MSKKHILAEYFDAAAESLSGISRGAGITGHPGDTGSNRETLIQDFINKHTPNRFTCYLGGKIIGLNQPPSKQIDCIVAADIVPKFTNHERSISIVESVAMAISIKSDLNKETLFNSLDNLASIPKISKNIIKQTSSIQMSGMFEKIEKIMPSLYVFAYKGIHPDTIMKHLRDYYAANPAVPWNRRPRAILVNQEYAIKYSIEQMVKENGVVVPPYTYNSFFITERPGYALTEIVVELSNLISWYNDLWIQFYHYINEAYLDS